MSCAFSTSQIRFMNQGGHYYSSLLRLRRNQLNLHLPPRHHPCLPGLCPSVIYRNSRNWSQNQSQSRSPSHCLHRRCLRCASSFFLADKKTSSFWIWSRVLSKIIRDGILNLLSSVQTFRLWCLLSVPPLLARLLPSQLLSVWLQRCPLPVAQVSINNCALKSMTADESEQKPKPTFSFLSFSTKGLRSPSALLGFSLLGGSPAAKADFSSSSSAVKSKIRRSWSVPPSIFITAEEINDIFYFDYIQFTMN